MEADRRADSRVAAARESRAGRRTERGNPPCRGRCHHRPGLWADYNPFNRKILMSTPMVNTSPPTVRGNGSRRSLAWPICWCLLGACLIASPAVRFTGALGFDSPPHASAAFVSWRPASLTIASNCTKAIEDVRVGDWVLARDPASGRLEARRVVKTYRRVSNHLRYPAYSFFRRCGAGTADHGRASLLGPGQGLGRGPRLGGRDESCGSPWLHCERDDDAS